MEASWNLHATAEPAAAIEQDCRRRSNEEDDAQAKEDAVALGGGDSAAEVKLRSKHHT